MTTTQVATPSRLVRILVGAVILLSLFTLSPTFAVQDEELPRGKVTEKVLCKADATQSYALYLPSSYTPEKKWPILYAFDPGARGRLPVNLFKEAAEKYGFIVVGSNNSKNAVEVRGVVEALWEDTHARFSIDDRRVYTAGFSGGARVACAAGYLYPKAVAGVIACGAGFPEGITPSSSTPFVLFGTSGTEDFNYPEMQQLNRTLNDLGIANRLMIFEGGHNWAPAPLLAEAVEWMEIQAMKAGRRAKDEALVEERFKRKVEEARAHEASGKYYDACAGYEAIAVEFKGLREVSEFKEKAQRLRSSKEVKEIIKNELEQEQRQARLMAEFDALVEQLQDPEVYLEAMGAFRSTVADLKKKSEEKSDSSERRVARRVLELVYAQSHEAMSFLYQRKNYALMVIKLEMAAEIKPNNARLLYDLATAYSLVGRKRKSLETLKRAIASGFADAAKMEQDQNLAPLRKEPEFQKLLEGLKKSK